MTDTKPHGAPPVLIRFFEFSHLPAPLREVSEPFHTLAHHIADTLPASAETTTALRKLLESKDCAVRAALEIPSPSPAMLKPRPIKDDPRA